LPVVAIDSTSYCSQLPQSAGWLTQASRSDKDFTCRAWRPGPRSLLVGNRPYSSISTSMPDHLAGDAWDPQRIRRGRPRNRCQPERGGLFSLKAGNIREIPAIWCFAARFQMRGDARKQRATRIGEADLRKSAPRWRSKSSTIHKRPRRDRRLVGLRRRPRAVD
jgi:hypothetical protein